MGGWYVVHCKPKGEDGALQHLGNQGYEVYRPTIEKYVFKSSVRQLIVCPMFPRYVFVRPSGFILNAMAINSTRGVDRLVCFAGIIPEITEAQMQGIKLKAQQIKAQCKLPDPKNIHIKEIKLGSFAEIPTRFFEYSSAERLSFLLAMIESNARNRAHRSRCERTAGWIGNDHPQL